MSVETIYMPLLNEGTEVWAPVRAERTGDGTYRVLGPMPDDQEWAFPLDTPINLQAKVFSDGAQGNVAVAISN